MGCWRLNISLQCGNRDFEMRSDSNSNHTSALEMVKSGGNLPSEKVIFSLNPGCALAEYHGHFSSPDVDHDLHVYRQ